MFTTVAFHIIPLNYLVYREFLGKLLFYKHHMSCGQNLAHGAKGQGFFAPLYGLVLPSAGKGFFRHASIGPPPTRFMLVCFVHLLWVLFGVHLLSTTFHATTRPPHVWGSFTFFCASLGVWVPFEPLLGPVPTFHATTPCLGVIAVFCTALRIQLLQLV